MQHFQFHSSTALDEALDFLAAHAGRCKIIAGGTDLIPVLRGEDEHPDVVLNILELDELKGIQVGSDAIRIGAATTFTQMVASEVLCRHLPLLCQAAACVGGPQIRNRGTLGGNIVTASPAADVLPAVMALDGQIEVRSKSAGTRCLLLTRALASPYETFLAADDILTAVIIPTLPPGTRCGFEKLGRRRAMTRARMNMSVVLRQAASGEVADIRIVPGAVMPVARRMTVVEEFLVNRRPSADRIAAAADLLGEWIVKITGRRWSTEYKLPVVKNVFKRVINRLLVAA